MDRREFMKLSLIAGSLLALGKDSHLTAKVTGKKETSKKVLVLGLDGMDPRLVEMWMKEGKLPHFARLASEGDFSSLGTSIPPQSPVAWSNFITGTNPGGHGIFDFVHRDPKSYLPEFSASQTEEAKKTFRIGNLVLPLQGGEVRLMRKGRAFWQVLEGYGVPAIVFKIPSNYPPADSKQRTISGMGTPDILGSYGIFNYYTNEPKELKEDIGGGRTHEVTVIDNTVEAKLPGPSNTFKKNRPESFIDFKVFIDPVNPVAKIKVGDDEFMLKEGEWSSWKRVRYKMIPTQNVSGICMFYLKQVRPAFKLYVSPVNIDPAQAALPISTPKKYSEELEKKFGPFFTKGLPADTSALDNNVLDDREFLEQDDFVLKESLDMFDYELARFNSGLLFYYISSTDQRQHMFWRLIDKNHPSYDSNLASRCGDTIEKIYIEMDRLLARALDKVDKDTVLVVMSDHGFSPFRYCFNLNTWLKENGFHQLIKPWKQEQEAFFLNTDWSKSKAYAIGLNSLYINQKGREAEGIVSPGSEKEALVREIVQKLESFVDPKTGEKPVLRAFVARDVYQGPYVEEAPDIVVGYNNGYRVSSGSALGRLPRDIIEDNKDKWSGDHCMAPEILPGILLTNQKIKLKSPCLYDLTPTILQAFGIAKPEEMIGRPVF